MKCRYETGHEALDLWRDGIVVIAATERLTSQDEGGLMVILRLGDIFGDFGMSQAMLTVWLTSSMEHLGMYGVNWS